IQPYANAWGLTMFHGPVAAAAVAPATVTIPHSARLSAVLWGRLREQPPRARDIGDPALPVLMVRDARAALAQSPDDPASYWSLFEAISILRDQENHWAQPAVDPVLV